MPSRKQEKKGSAIYRYLAIRVRRQQGEFWADGVSLRHFAVVTNCWEMEVQVLQPEYTTARPKWLRFAVFSHIGQVVLHAGKVLMRIRSRVLEVNWDTR
ncbi:hypothetical protein ACFLX9_01120 [Chloroflexota bacterium]